MAAAASGFGAGAIASGAAADRATRSLAKYAAVAAIAGGGFGGGPRAPLALSGGGGGGRGTSFFGRGFSGGAPRNPGFWGWSSGLGVGAPPPGGGAPPGGGGGGGGGGLPIGGMPGFVANQARRAFEWGAAAGGAGMVDAISSAASMQKTLIGVQNSTGASDAQIAALRQKAFDTGDVMGMTAAKTADLFAVIARSSGGVFNDKNGRFDMRAFTGSASTIAEIARMQNLTRGVDTDHAAQTVIQLMHLFRTYSGAPLAQTGDLLTRLSEMMPDSLDVARNQFTYFLPQFKALGISNKDSVATMAMLDRWATAEARAGRISPTSSRPRSADYSSPRTRNKAKTPFCGRSASSMRRVTRNSSRTKARTSWASSSSSTNSRRRTAGSRPSRISNPRSVSKARASQASRSIRSSPGNCTPSKR
jgi:hypothetical protein